MPFGLGYFATAGAGAQAGSFEWIQTTTLTSDTATINFTGLGSYSSTYSHYRIMGLAQCAASGSLALRINNDSASNYAQHKMNGETATANSNSGFSNSSIGLMSLPVRGNEANTFAGFVIDVINAHSTSRNKTVRYQIGSTQTSFQNVTFGTGFIQNTAAITELNLFMTSGSMSSKTSISIYGIRGS